MWVSKDVVCDEETSYMYFYVHTQVCIMSRYSGTHLWQDLGLDKADYHRLGLGLGLGFG